MTAKFIKDNLVFINIIFVLSVIFFLIRLPNLTLQPIFADEAIYIRWAQIMKAEPTLRFLPLSDGKTPLFMWILMGVFKVFDDPLFAGRMLSIFAGFATFLGAITISWKFFNKTAAFFAATLITFTPMIFFFDRMALVDSMMSAFFIWSLFFALLLMHYPRLDLAMILGFTIGGGWLTKTPGFFAILTLPATLFSFNWHPSTRAKRAVKILMFWLISVTIALAIYNALRLGPGFSSLSARNSDYVFSPQELSGRPLDPFIPHLNDLIDWLPKMLTLPVLALIILAFFAGLFKFNRLVLAIFAWGLIPLTLEVAFLRTFTARYILFSFPPFLIAAAWLLSEAVKKFQVRRYIASALALTLILPMSIYFDYLLLFDQEKAPLPREERRGYFEDWTAGYNFKELSGYFEELSKTGQIVVGTEGSFGTLPDGLAIYLDKNRNVIIVPGQNVYSKELINASLRFPTFFVANRSRVKAATDWFDPLFIYPKFSGPDLPQDAIMVYRLNLSKVASDSANLAK